MCQAVTVTLTFCLPPLPFSPCIASPLAPHPNTSPSSSSFARPQLSHSDSYLDSFLPLLSSLSRSLSLSNSYTGTLCPFTHSLYSLCGSSYYRPKPLLHGIVDLILFSIILLSSLFSHSHHNISQHISSNHHPLFGRHASFNNTLSPLSLPFTLAMITHMQIYLILHFFESLCKTLPSKGRHSGRTDETKVYVFTAFVSCQKEK